ncbi:MAG: hypothetical protein AAF840_01765, partial [Bacteroidota bacterium]
VLRGKRIFLLFWAMTIKYRAQQWLAVGGSFRDGVSLLEMAGSIAARRHSRILQQAYISTKQKQALRNDLVRLISQLPEDDHPAPASSPAPAATTQKIPDTPRIIALRKQAISLHKERSDLKSRLLAQSLDDPDKYTDEDRYKLAQLIMDDNVPALDAIYDQVRRFEEEGIEPADDATMIKEDTVAKMKRVYSLRPQISRLKKRAEQGDKDAKEELSTKMNELESLEDELGLSPKE